ncbi:MAG: vitamin K epoxide reductase family protein [Chthonomonadales bacterium]
MNSALTNRILFVLALAGIGVSGYLTLAHLNYIDLGCSAVRGCEEVAAHYTAKGFGIPMLRAIPTAAFGLAMYAAMGLLCVIRAGVQDAGRHRAVAMAQWLLSAASLLVSAWLTYLEAYVIRAWCQWCVASAVIVLAMFVMLSAERLGTRRVAQGAAQ